MAAMNAAMIAILEKKPLLTLRIMRKALHFSGPDVFP